MNKDVQPIFILPEGTQRKQGRNAQRNNILAAKLVAETVRTTLGPKGMDKMLVDALGEVIVTNDGVTILKEMQIEHPAAKMIVEVAKTQEDEVGDGTTTAVVLAGEFLKKAEELLDMEIHPTVIVKGYRLAASKALDLHSMIYKDCYLLKIPFDARIGGHTLHATSIMKNRLNFKRISLPHGIIRPQRDEKVLKENLHLVDIELLSLIGNEGKKWKWIDGTKVERDGKVVEFKGRLIK